jgi:hypothetical protein
MWSSSFFIKKSMSSGCRGIVLAETMELWLDTAEAPFAWVVPE